MSHFVVYDVDTGRIIRSGNVPDGLEAAQALSPQEGVLQTLASTPPVGCRVDLSLMQIVDIPAKPSDSHEWDWVEAQWVDARTLAAARSARVIAMKRSRDAVVFGGLTWDGSVFDSDARSQSVIEAIFTDARLNEDDPDQPFRLADNSWRVLTRADKVALGTALRAHVRGAFAAFAARESEINAASTIAEVDAVEWE